MNKPRTPVLSRAVMVAACVVLFAGCASISERTNVYLGSPKYPPTAPAAVQILSADPKRPADRLGEIFLSVDGKPTRERLENKLKTAAAQLGADAVFIVSDRTHIFPIAYGNWWGPVGVMEDSRRHLVAVAVKFK
jgi:hypothetical protein